MAVMSDGFTTRMTFFDNRYLTDRMFESYLPVALDCTSTVSRVTVKHIRKQIGTNGYARVGRDNIQNVYYNDVCVPTAKCFK